MATPAGGNALPKEEKKAGEEEAVAPAAESKKADDADAETPGALTKQMAGASIKSEAKDEEEGVQRAFGGLHPDDAKAEIVLKGVDQSMYKAAKTFEDLGLSQALLDGVYGMKFSAPSRIQAEALPIVLAPNRPNLIGQAHHGSGKTAAYSLSMLCRVDENKEFPQAVCVCPVRELARQVADVCQTLGKFTKIKVFEAIPGSSKTVITAQVVVGTPGTLIAKTRGKELNMKRVQIFVADEADQMIDKQGHGENTMKLRKMLGKECQILLFSATFSDRVRTFAVSVAPKAVEITVKREDLSLDGIKQFYVDCKTAEGKYGVLKDFFGLDLKIGQTIIFVHTVATAKSLTNKMRADGFTVSVLHGKDMEPKQRDKVMDDFRSGATTVLITTNVLSRGIDVLQVTLVINFDIPLTRNNQPDPETYIHRIGRSGRFGRKGVAINFVYDQTSMQQLAFIAKYYQKDVLQLPMDDLEKVENTVKDALK